MKRIRINEGKVGLVFRNGDYRKVIIAGTTWLSLADTVMVYNLTDQFYSSKNLNILLRDEELAAMLEVVDVKDNEFVIQYADGKFKQVLSVGKYAFWKGLVEYTFNRVDLSDFNITQDISKAVLTSTDLLRHIRVYVVESYEKGLLMIDGKLEKTLDKGTYYFWKNTTAINVLKADMRKLQMEVSGQEILTKDKAGLRINSYCQYKVVDIEKFLIDNKDAEKQLYVLMQLALREYIGNYTLDELLEQKSAIAEYVLEVLKSKAETLGIEIRDCGVKDIILSGELRNIMNQVLVAQKQAQANVITRREETASTRSLLNTAKLMEDNDMLFKLKEMEYVERIADKINNISLSGGNQMVDQLKEIFSR
ncbi:slipin family protein [Roseivirga pacifica]|uniref:slipin family protein n=1 Tax=Roseivirga pacifica TaxID=1267423 RepID=UPI0020952AC8|nr:slipin family protein [Roseivirga pacifica]MCO6360929.1 slipin family protein [Roseivirga pacifica]MCO6368818.1 slipin family protein [Roseivirga pacifica]MCO6372962.1 slipin family protein [Roseivirga pacifica]MCO6377022.1 slipin family protein [Roseivirga pacifica]MCO6377701.1 slipin family protein [Roseivirga pacifica]